MRERNVIIFCFIYIMWTELNPLNRTTVKTTITLNRIRVRERVAEDLQIFARNLNAYRVENLFRIVYYRPRVLCAIRARRSQVRGAKVSHVHGRRHAVVQCTTTDLFVARRIGFVCGRSLSRDKFVTLSHSRENSLFSAPFPARSRSRPTTRRICFRPAWCPASRNSNVRGVRKMRSMPLRRPGSLASREVLFCGHFPSIPSRYRHPSF